MSLEFADRVMVASATTGTGTLTLGSAIAGHRTFTPIGNGNTCVYHIEEVDANGLPTGEWELGIGTYTAAGTLLSRDRVLASSGAKSVPTLGTITTDFAAAGSTSYSPASPAVSAGQLLLGIALTGNSASRVITSNNNEWQMCRSSTVGTGASANMRVFWRVATASEPANYSFALTDTFTNVSFAIIPVNGMDLDALQNFADTITFQSGATDTVVSPDVTVVEDNSLLLRFVGDGRDSNSFTAPAGHTEILDVSQSALFTLTAATKTANAGAAGTANFIGALNWHDGYHMITAALPPAYPKVSFTNALRVRVVAAAEKVGGVDIQTFEDVGVWLKPYWAKNCDIICVSGGGGGGTGGRNTGVTRGGGGAGSGGVISRALFNADDLPDRVTVLVGQGGAGAVGQTGTISVSGTDGGDTTFGSYVFAPGGDNGIGATTGAGAGGAARGTTGLFQQASLAGATSVDGGAGNAGAASTTVQCTGGGAGGGWNGAAQNGGAGGAINANTVRFTAVAGGTAGVAGGTIDGGTGNFTEWIYGIRVGTGGGGGAAVNVGPGGAGGQGGAYGGGGGGGGTAESNSTGNGGRGGHGFCIVVST